MIGAWHLRASDDALAELGSNDGGLSGPEASRRLAEHGPNSIPTQHRPTVLRLVFDQFRDPLVVVLLIAAILSYLASEVIDSVIILILVVVNAAIGAGQQIAARRSLRALRAGLPPSALAMRDGAQVTVPASDLVPGDVVLLAQGDRVPADLRLIEVSGLCIDESTLTGESIPVEKQLAPVAADAEVADWTNICFSSTFVTRGRGAGVVVATGTATQIGQIAGALGGSEPPTPLQRQLAKLGVIAGVGAAGVAATLFIVGMLQGRGLLSTALLAVSLAVAAIPEGLVAISALILAGSVRRMAKRGAIVRTLSAVETIGAASVICVDKTGTLTENRMTVVESWEPDSSSPSSRLLRIAALCNDASWTAEGETGTGDPMEVALARWVHERGLSRVDAETRYPRISEVPFDSYRKLMTTVHRAAADTWLVTTKGSIDELLARCTAIDADELERIRRVHDDYAARGLRILAFADRYSEQDDVAWEEHLQFVGLVGLEDPPREGVAEAIERCERAGITPMMITGDHIITARVIGERLGLLRPGRSAITGRELAELSDSELRARITSIAIVARATPDSKVRVVDAWQARGAIVAMAGDGVNDAPALKRADVGCAMGRVGTDVARDAADLVIVDDHFSTIVDAVEEGRRTHHNLRKAVSFLLSTNIGEVVLLVLAVSAGLPAPLTAAQILLINLITDGAPALALAADPADRDAMSRPPAAPALTSRSDLARLILQGTIFGGTALLAFLLADPASDLAFAQTIAFTTLAMSQVLHSLSARFTNLSVFGRRSLDNVALLVTGGASIALTIVLTTAPVLSTVLGFVALQPTEFLACAALAAGTLGVVEAAKLIRRLSTRSR